MGAPVLHVIVFGGNGRQKHGKTIVKAKVLPEEDCEEISNRSRWATRGPLAVLCALLSLLPHDDEQNMNENYGSRCLPSSEDEILSHSCLPQYLHHPNCPQSEIQSHLPRAFENLKRQLLNEAEHLSLFQLLVPMLLVHSRTFALCCLWKATRRPRRLASFLTCMQRAMQHAPPCKTPPQVYCFPSWTPSVSRANSSHFTSRQAHCEDPNMGFHSPSEGHPTANARANPAEGIQRLGIESRLLRASPTVTNSDEGLSIKSCRLLTPDRRLGMKQNRQKEKKGVHMTRIERKKMNFGGLRRVRCLLAKRSKKRVSLESHLKGLVMFDRKPLLLPCQNVHGATYVCFKQTLLPDIYISWHIYIYMFFAICI